jgi:2-hydroxy-6-oxonona-2,4-dienedioate hydrolase
MPPAIAASPGLAAAERALFASVGVTPVEHRIGLEHLGIHVRVLEMGSGPPVVFLHGTMTAGPSWASLAAGLPGFRCLLVDRPGCGLSESPSPPARSLADQERVADLLIVEVLDALRIERGHLVSTSLGGWYAFRGAARHPERIGGMVGMGFQVGARIDRVPLFMRLQPPSPLAGRLPVSSRMLRAMLRTAGMRGAIDSGAFSAEMLDWMVALMKSTDTMRNELLTAPRPVGLRGPIDAVRLPAELARQLTVPVHLPTIPTGASSTPPSSPRRCRMLRSRWCRTPVTPPGSTNPSWPRRRYGRICPPDSATDGRRLRPWRRTSGRGS